MENERVMEVATLQLPGNQGPCYFYKVLPEPDGRLVAVIPMMFTSRLIVGEVGEPTYEDCYCYDDLSKALAAAMDYDGVNEPDGWIKHPETGRRRENGDPQKETRRW